MAHKKRAEPTLVEYLKTRPDVTAETLWKLLAEEKSFKEKFKAPPGEFYYPGRSYELNCDLREFPAGVLI